MATPLWLVAVATVLTTTGVAHGQKTAPKAGDVNADTDKVDAPKKTDKVDAPKGAPKVDAPKGADKVDAPKVDAPKVDAPKGADKVDAPKGAPKVDVPKVDAPKVDAPKGADKVDAPKVDAPPESPKAPIGEAPRASDKTDDSTPNPFEDYANGEPPPEPEAPVAVASPAPSGKTTGRSHDAYRSDQGTWSTGLGLQFAYTGASLDLIDGSEETNRTMFARVVPHLRVFVVDGLEVGIGLGLLSKLSSREGGNSATENNFLIEANVGYHIELGDTPFALVPSAAVGMYVGGSSRTFLLPTGQSIDEITDTIGFSGGFTLGIAYQPDTHFRLRSGLAFGFLAGTESYNSTNRTVDSTAAHIGLPFELSYIF